MSLLREVQAAAIDPATSLAATLRKCKLLAARLGSKPLEEWIVFESNGYPNAKSVPSYRRFVSQISGHFAGPFGSGLRNADIPENNIPAEIRDYCRQMIFTNSVAELETMLTSGVENGMLQSPIGADMVQIFSARIYKDMRCMQAWRQVPAIWIVDILNVVRNKVLDFAIEIEKVNAEAGEAILGSPLISPNAVNQVFNTTVYGGAASLVGSAQSSSITAPAIASGDFIQMERALSEAGMLLDDIKSLRQAIASDPRPSDPNRLGPSVSEWIGQMTSKAASGAWKIGSAAAGNLLARLIASYYGFPQ